MASSWKKYGGTNKLDRMNSMNVNNLTTDAFSLQTPYQGDFDICGNLYVNDVFAKNLVANNDLTVNGTLNAAQLDVANLIVNTDSVVYGNLNVNGVLTFDTSGISQKSYFTAIGEKLGLNTMQPNATLDIYGNSVSSLNVFSELDYTRNIIAQNGSHRGIAVETDSSSSSIAFYNDASMAITNPYSARIQYTKPGTLNIDVPDTTNLLSNVVISNRTDLSNILTSSLTVYDVSSGVYQQNVYQNTSAKAGNSLTMIANDVSSVTIMHMITPNQKGLAVAAGAYPVDQSRSMATLGWMDTTGTSNVSPSIIPSQMIVSGNNRSKYMSTIGINTYAPRTDHFVLDINGPIHVANGQLRVAQNARFEIKEVNRSVGFTDKLIAVGSPSTLTAPYVQNVYYSVDGGQSWNIAEVDPIPRITDLTNAPNTFNSIYTYADNFSVMAGQGTYIFYTVNQGRKWSQLGTTISTIFNSVYIDGSYVNLISDTTLYYFLSPYPNNINFPNPVNIDVTLLEQTMGGFTTLSPAKSIFGNGTHLYVCGVQYILKYSQFTHIFENAHSVGRTYYSVHCYGANNVIAVGSDIISYSKDNGNNWTNYYPSVNLKSVFILDEFRAVAAGDSGVVLFTQDGYITWSPIPPDILRVSGNAGIINDASNSFVSIRLVDIDTLVLSATRASYGSTTGNSYLFYCFLPSLFNAENNRILDLCGNMLVSGKVEVEEGIFVEGTSRICTTTISANAVDVSGNVSTDNLSVRGNVFLQNATVGNLVVKNNATIESNITMSGTMATIRGNVSITQLTESFSSTTGALVVSGGVGIGGNVYVGHGEESVSTSSGTVVVSGGVGIRANTFVGGNLVVRSKEIATSTSTGAVQIAGGVGIGGNVYVGHGEESVSTSSGTVVVSGGVGIRANTFVGGNLVVHSQEIATSTSTGAVQIAGGVGIGGNVYVGHGEESISTSSGTLVVSGGVGISANTFVGGNLVVHSQEIATSTSTGAVKIAGGVGIGGNVYVGHGEESVSTSSGTLVVSGGVGIRANTFVGGNLVVRSQEIATSTSTGAVQIAGGVGIGGNVYVGHGEESVSTSSGTLVVSGGVGIRANTFVGGNLVVRSKEIATSTSTGAVQIVGGVGIGGNVYVGHGEESVSTSSGTVVVSGGVGIGANAFVGGNLVVRSNQISTSTSTGALLVEGGAGISGNVFVGGRLIATNTTNTSSYSTGSLVVSGGVGIGGNLYVGGNVVVDPSSAVFIQNTDFQRALVVSGGGVFNGNVAVSGNLTVGGNILVTGNVNYTSDNLVESTTESYSPSTGSSINKGGTGIAANLFVGGNSTVYGNSFIYSHLFVLGNSAATSTSTGTVQVAGGVGVGGNLYVGHGEESYSATTGTVVVSGGLGVSANTYVDGVLVVGSATISTSTSTGAFRVLNGAGIGGNLNVGGVAIFRNANASLDSATTGGLQTIGGAGIGGNLYVYDQLRMRTDNYLNKKIILHDNSFNENIVNGNTFYGFGVQANELKYHTISGATHKFYGGSADGNLNAGALTLTSTADSTNSTNSGGLRVAGGAAIGGNVYAARLFRSANTNDNKKVVVWDSSLNEPVATATNFFGFGINDTNKTLRYQTDSSSSIHRFYSGSSAGIVRAGTLQLDISTTSTDTATGAFRVEGGAGIGGNLNVGGIVRFLNTTQSGSNITGALQVSGGIGVAGNVHAANIVISGDGGSISTSMGALRVVGGVGIGGNVFVGGQTVINNTNASFLSSTTGALVVSGGVGVGGNAYVENMIRMSANNLHNKKIVLVDSSANESPENATQFYGFGVKTGVLRYQTNATTSTHQFFSGNSDGILVGGNLRLNTNNDSNSTATGTLRVEGGAGIGGNLNVGGITRISNTTQSGSNTTGALQVLGGVGIAGNVHAANIVLSGDSGSTSTATGTLRVVGGAGIGGNVYVGGQTIINNTNASFLSSTTGALVVSGGVGVGGNAYVENMIRMSATKLHNKKMVLVDSSANESPENATQFYGFGVKTGVLRYQTDASSSIHRFYSGGEDGVVVAGNLELKTNNASNSTGTGTLRVGGGAGIGGNLNVGGITRISNTTFSSSTTSGSFVVDGGVGIGGNLNIGGATVLGNNVTTNARIQQILNSGANWNNTVNGYYALAKRVAPLPNPSSAGIKAISTWTARPIEASTWRSVCWSPQLSLFVAVASADTNRVATSPDGITWTPRSAASAVAWAKVVWSPQLSLFVAISSNSTMWSSNGTSWTLGTGFPSMSNAQALSWSPELRRFVVLGRDSVGATSTDGKNWASFNVDFSYNWYDMTWSPELGLFCAISRGNTLGTPPASIMTSSTGTTGWTIQPLPTGTPTTTEINSITWSAELGLFAIAYGPAGSNRVATSPDGITWTQRTTSGSFAPNSILWSPELGLFVVGLYNTTNLLYSTDGINWNLMSGFPSGQLTCGAWSPELGIFVFLFDLGTNRLITSSLKGRPPTSYNVFDNRYFKVDENNNWSIGYNTSTDLKRVDMGNVTIHQSGPLNTPQTTIQDASFANAARSLRMFPNMGAGNTYNPIIQQGDQVILGSIDSFSLDTDVSLVLYLPFNSNFPGQELWNYNKYYVDGTITNNIASQPSGYGISTTKKAVGNASFDISTAAVSPLTLNSYSGMGNFSIAWWMNADPAIDNSGRMLTISTDASFTTFGLWSFGNYSVTSQVFDPGFASFLPPRNSEWVHIVLQFNSSGYTELYVNGAKRFTGTNASFRRTTTTSVIINLGGELFSGRRYLDDLRMYNRPLTDADVFSLYNYNNRLTTGSSLTLAPQTMDTNSSGIRISSSTTQISSRNITVDGAMTANKRVQQTLNTGANWLNTTNGYYALAKRVAPLPSPSSAGVKAVSSWTERVAATTSNEWRSICWSAELGLFVAVASNGNTSNQVMTSPDGINWRSASSPAALEWQSVCWAKEAGLFVAVASSGTGNPSLNYADFSSIVGVTLVGNATQVGSDIQLTPNSTSQAGTAWFNQLSTRYDRDFSIQFRFHADITGATATPGDGFSIQWNPSSDASGALGAEMGVSVFSPFAIRFSVTNQLVTLVLSQVPQQSINPLISLRSDLYYWIDYTYSTQRINVFISSTNTKPSSATVAFTTTVVFPSTPYFVGFGAGTGNNTTRHLLKSFNLNLYLIRAMYSTTGTTGWTLADGATVPDNMWSSVCWSPELRLFVAVATSGSRNRVMTSTNGILWTVQKSVADNEWNSVCWSAELGLFCAVASTGTGNQVMTSTDGINWVSQVTQVTTETILWRSVCWSPELGLFCAVATTTPWRAMTSPDGINWTLRTLDSTILWSSVCWSPDLGLFVACSTRFAYSSDGINWSLSSQQTSNTRFRSICWSPELGIFAAVAADGNYRVRTSSFKGRPPTSTNVFDNPIMPSRVQQILNPDPSWNNTVNGYYAIAKRVAPLPNVYSSADKAFNAITYRGPSNGGNTYGLRAICWAPERMLFVSVGQSNLILTSPDGIIWNVITAPTTSPITFTSIVWSRSLNLFVAVASAADTNGNNIMTSSDGSNWTARISGVSSTWTGVCWSPELGLFVAVAIGGTNRVMYSSNGTTTWTGVNAPLNVYTGVCWAPELGLFIACSTNGITTSPDGIVWTNRFTGQSFYAICWSPELGISLASGVGIIYSSKDGMNWSLLSTESGGNSTEGMSITWAAELGVFIHLSVNRWRISYNEGANWTLKFTSGTYSAWKSVCWSPELGIACGVCIGDTGAIATSSLKGRPPTSYNVFDNSYLNVDENNNWSIGYGGVNNIKTVQLGEVNVRGATVLGNNVTTNTRIQQILNSGASWNITVNGYYALAKKVAPLPSPFSAGVKAVSTWTTRIPADVSGWYGITWSPERALFVSTARLRTGNRIQTSPDGINWTIRASPADYQWDNVIWVRQLNLFIASSSTGGTNDQVMTSSTGTGGWNLGSTPNAAYNGIAWSPELSLGVMVGTNAVATSTNGTNWTARTIPNASWDGVCWAPELGLFVAIGNTGVSTSSDGINWSPIITLGTSSLNPNRVCWSAELGLLVAVRSTVFYTSPDGVNWTARTLPTNDNKWVSIVWAAELGLFIAGAESGSTTTRIMTSPDGINWTIRASTAIGGGFYGLAWSPELGIAAAPDYNGNSILTSSLRGRPPTSYNVFDNTYHKVDENNNWTIGWNSATDKKIVTLGDVYLRGDNRFIDLVNPNSKQTQVYKNGDNLLFIGLNENSGFSVSNRTFDNSSVDTFVSSTATNRLTATENIIRSTTTSTDAALRIATDTSSVFLEPKQNNAATLKNLYFRTNGGSTAHLGIDSADGSVVIATNTPASGCKLTVNGKTQTIDLDVSNNLLLSGVSGSISTATGALRVVGGAGIGGNVFVGGQTVINNTNASFLSSTTGALVVSGGVGIGGNAYVENMIRMSSTANNKKMVLVDSSANESPASATQFYGFGVNSKVLRYQTDASSSIHRFYSGAEDGVVVAGNLALNTNNASISTATGTLRVAGGVGIGGNLNVGGYTVLYQTGSSNLPEITLQDSNSTRSIRMFPNITGSIHNSVIGTGNQVILGSPQDSIYSSVNTDVSLVMYHPFDSDFFNYNRFYVDGTITNNVSSGSTAGHIIFYGRQVKGTGSLFSGDTMTRLVFNNVTLGPSFAIAWWMFAASSTISQARMITIQLSSTVFDIISYINANYVYTVGGGGGIFDPSFAAFLPTGVNNTWYHMVLQFNTNGYTELYVNNALVFTGTNLAFRRTTSSSINVSLLGSDVSVAGRGRHIDDLRVYNRSLSSTDVANIFNFVSSSSPSLVLTQPSTSGAGISIAPTFTQINSSTTSFGRNGDLIIFGRSLGQGSYNGISRAGDSAIMSIAPRDDISPAISIGTWTEGSVGIRCERARVYIAAKGASAETEAIYGSAEIQLDGITRVLDSSSSFSTTTGAFRVAGGAGIVGNIYVGGQIFLKNSSASLNNSTTGALVVDGGVGVGGNVFVNNMIRTTASVRNKKIVLYDSAENDDPSGATNFYGFGINDNVLRYQVPGTGNSHRFYSGTSDGNVIAGFLELKTNLTSTNTDTGTLRVAGGAGIGGALNVGSTASILSSVTIGSNSTTPGRFIQLGVDTANRSYIDFGSSDVTSGIDYSTRIISSGGSLLGTGTLEVEAASTTFKGTEGSTSTATGALRVVGGAGIGGALYVGGQIFLKNSSASLTGTTGALVVDGGVGVGGNVFVNNMLRIANNVHNKQIVLYDLGSNDDPSGATNFYGFGINNNVLRYQTPATSNSHIFYSGTSNGTIVAGILQLNINQTSTSTSTGTLRVVGGVGIGGALNVGGASTLTTATFNTGSTTNGVTITGSGSRAIRFYTNLSSGSPSSIVQAGDNGIFVPSTDRLCIGVENVTSGIRISSTTVAISSTTGNPVTMNNGLTVSGAAATMQNGLTVSGAAATMNNGLTVTGTATMNNALTVTGSATMNNGLTVTGTVTATTFNATSDYRIKSNIVALGITDYSIDKLKPVYYYNTISNKNDIGFIAHEVQEELPFLVSGEKDGEINQTLNYLGLIGILVKEVQELKKANAELVSSNAELVSSNAELKKEFKEFKELVMSKW